MGGSAVVFSIQLPDCQSILEGVRCQFQRKAEGSAMSGVKVAVHLQIGVGATDGVPVSVGHSQHHQDV